MSAPIESSGQTTHGSSRKRRASQACSTCRARKVRCDMLETGLPCSRCRIDRFECATEPRKKRGRRAVHGHAPNLEVRDEAPGTGSPPPPFLLPRVPLLLLPFELSPSIVSSIRSLTPLFCSNSPMSILTVMISRRRITPKDYRATHCLSPTTTAAKKKRRTFSS
ncbi:hypothetical protein VTN96DRAFT_475 [Rasamsonia emersonii]